MSKRVENLKTILDYINYRTDKKIAESKNPDELKAIIDFTQHLTDTKIQKIKEELAPIPGPRGIEGADGLDGIQGDRGIQGTTGEKGNTGELGPRGGKGDQGIQGVQGIKGNRGEEGIQGIEGIQGLKGIQGNKGNTGEQGFQGTKGDKGDKGNKGDEGIQGIQGEQGIQGTLGPKGSKGSKGEKGNEGPIGLEGPKGFKGSKGPKGSIGEQGEKGPKGTKGNGFTFDELSDEQIKKITGPKGKNFDKKLFEESLKNLDKQFNKRVRSMRQDINKTLDEAVRKSDTRDTQHRRQTGGTASNDLLVAGGGLAGAPEAGYIEFIAEYDDARTRQFYPGQLVLYYSSPSSPITEFDSFGRPTEEQKGDEVSFYRVTEQFTISTGSTPSTFEEADTLGYVTSITGDGGSVSNTYRAYQGNTTNIAVGSYVYIDNPAKAGAAGTTYDPVNFLKLANAANQFALADGIVSKIDGETITVTRFGVVEVPYTIEAGMYYLLANDGSVTQNIPTNGLIQYVGQAINENELFVKFTIDPEAIQIGDAVSLIDPDANPNIAAIAADNRYAEADNSFPLVGTTILDETNNFTYIAVRSYTEVLNNPTGTDRIWIRVNTDNTY